MQLKQARGVLIETDVLADFLLFAKNPATNERSALRYCLSRWPCFTTFVQASGLLACAQNAGQKAIVDHALCSVKILGAHARYADAIASNLHLNIGSEALNFRDSIVLAIAHESRLAIASRLHRVKFEPYCEIVTIEEI